MPDGAIQSIDELREIYRPPGRPALDKQIDHLDEHCRSFIAHAPFVVVGTTDGDGRCDVSPKGGPPGFVTVLHDHALVIPDLSGNNRLDSLQNLVACHGIALLFMIPGIDETLRVNGTASITTAPDVLDRATVMTARPRVAIVVDVHEAFIHCAKALRRGKVWQASDWPNTTDMPAIACMLRDHAVPVDSRDSVPVQAVHDRLESDYRATLWQPGGDVTRS